MYGRGAFDININATMIYDGARDPIPVTSIRATSVAEIVAIDPKETIT